MSGDGFIRTVRDRKGSVSDGAELFDSANLGEGACKTGGTREGRSELEFDLQGGAICGAVFRRGSCFPRVTVTADGDSGMGDVTCDEPKGFEGAKRTPCWRGAAGADTGAYSRELS
jgi:hypothetical protein